MAKTIAACNRKGGVGKSTTLYHLTRAAHLAGRRVLVVDIDPQGNLSSALARDELRSDLESMADVLSPEINASLRSVIVPGLWENVDVAPAVGQTLDVVLIQLAILKHEQQTGKKRGPGVETRLRTALADVADDYDLILIDCPPAMNELTENALVAADGVLAMSEADRWSADGLHHQLGAIERVRKHYNKRLRTLGVLINNYEQHTIVDQKAFQEIGDAIKARKPPVRAINPPMPHIKKIKEARGAGYGLDEWPVDRSNARYLASVYSGYLTTLEEGLS